MKSVNIQAAEANLAELVEEAAPSRRRGRIDFLEKEFREGLIKVPDDLGTMEAEYTENLFAGEIA